MRIAFLLFNLKQGYSIDQVGLYHPMGDGHAEAGNWIIPQTAPNSHAVSSMAR
ncbi:MAG: hypothetical protein BWY83_02833 [bacterium ADurb.Bin478]|nr:MAG: hypothetical protein BWY83_02833 [bacterium ADurb.Bin478]